MSHVPASAGYTGAGATVINDDIDRHAPGNVVASHLEHDHNKNAYSEGIHAAHGGAGGPADHDTCSSMKDASNTDAPTRGERGPVDMSDSQPKSHAMQGTGTQGSVLGAGADAPVNVAPIPGQGPLENPTAKDKAQVKTAVAVAGVQEDLKGLRDRLASTQAGAGQGGALTGTPQEGAADAAKPSMKDRMKNFAVKTIDHTQTALEGAKQKVTKHTTKPAVTAPES